MQAIRLIGAAASGGLFGAGLYVSGMTDTRKVQGWLDVFGDWDPTLAFVLGGAIPVMMVAWAIASHLDRALIGAPFPAPNTRGVTPRLVVGALLFGAGWGLVGLCPGPAMASLSYGGMQGITFMGAMIVGMWLAPRFSYSARRSG